MTKTNNISNINFSPLVQIETDCGVKEMISLARIGIPDGITEVSGNFPMRFERDSGREISGGVFAREPIGVDVQIFIDGLFKTELSADARCRRNDVFRKIISAAGDARFGFKSFADLRVGVVADVVTFVAKRNKNIVTDDNRHTIFFIVINAPFDRRNERRRIISGINVAGNVQSEFDITACADDHARHERRKPSQRVVVVCLKSRIEFKINFAFVQNVRRRHVKNCLLCICAHGKCQKSKNKKC